MSEEVKPLEAGLSVKLNPIRRVSMWGQTWEFDPAEMGNDPDLAPAAVHDGTRWSIHYHMLIAALVADMKDLSAKMDQLEEVVLAQRKLIEKLSKRNAPSAR